MKKSKQIWGLLCALLICLAGTMTARADIQSEMTILVYLCGSDLEADGGEASTDLKEIIRSGIGASSQINVIVATGGASSWDAYGISDTQVQYYKVDTNGITLLSNAGEQNMGETETLSSFISYGKTNYQANRYMLILWDHGGGPLYGVCYDENYNDDCLTLEEMSYAINSCFEDTMLDILCFDACLMNAVDTFSVVQQSTRYVIASQELVSGTGMDYDGWMGQIINNPYMDDLSLCHIIADTYVSDNSSGRYADTVTISVIDSEKIPALEEALEVFSSSLSNLLGDSLSSVSRLRQGITSFGEFLDDDASDLIDIQTMCASFSAILPDECDALSAAAKEAVVYNATTSDIASQAYGVSVFMPFSTLDYSDDIFDFYQGQESEYAGMITAMTTALSDNSYSFSGSYTPNNFYTSASGNTSGTLVSIWNGLNGVVQGNTNNTGGIWDSLGGSANESGNSGSIWGGLGGNTNEVSNTGNIWDGLNTQTQNTQTASAPSIWSGLGTPSNETNQLSPISGIWGSLLEDGSSYYQSDDTTNQNVQQGISEAVTAEEIVQTADAYFSSSSLTRQSVYSLQLNSSDLDHLAGADGVLLKKNGDVLIELGSMGQTTIDWSTGLIISMFDGSWPTISGQMVSATMFEKTDDSVRIIIPAEINGLKMYLLVSMKEGDTQGTVLGATQGYDSVSGTPARGYMTLTEGMQVVPLFTCKLSDGSTDTVRGEAMIVPADGLTFAFSAVPAGEYQYSFALHDIYGNTQLTNPVELQF